MSKRKPDPVPRLTRVLVMAEYGVGDPIWDRSEPFVVGAFDPADLEISENLRGRLRDWNKTYERYALTDFRYAPLPLTEESWVREGLMLAYHLQNELWDIDVCYFHNGDERPLREIRG